MEKILFAQLTKVDEAKHLIYGRAVEEVPDSAGEILDYASSKPYFEAWSQEFAKVTDGKSLGNLRAMHNPKLAAGKIVSLDFLDDEKAIDICAEVVDEREWEKVEKGVYTGFSVGGKYVGAKRRDGNFLRYTAQPNEISLADRPTIRTSRYTLVKADGSEEQREFLAKADTSQSDAGYADPGLQKDKKLRYPLKINGALNEKRIRAAWNYINKEKNAAVYSADNLAKVKDAIIAAWKEAIDKEGPPSAVAKTDQAGELRKSMWQVGSLAGLLSSLQDLTMSVDWEAAYEMDDSEIPNRLKAWLEQGAEIFKDLAAEEVDELIEDLMTKTDAAGDLAKAGAEISAKNKEHIQQIHDHAAALGASCGGGKTEKVDQAETLTKVADLEGQIQGKDEELAKVTAEKDEALAKVAAENDALQKEVNELKAQPAPAKGVTRAISKEEDNPLEKVEKPEEPKSPLEAIQQAHQRPFLLNK